MASPAFCFSYTIGMPSDMNKGSTICALKFSVPKRLSRNVLKCVSYHCSSKQLQVSSARKMIPIWCPAISSEKCKLKTRHTEPSLHNFDTHFVPNLLKNSEELYSPMLHRHTPLKDQYSIYACHFSNGFAYRILSAFNCNCLAWPSRCLHLNSLHKVPK